MRLRFEKRWFCGVLGHVSRSRLEFWPMRGWGGVLEGGQHGAMPRGRMAKNAKIDRRLRNTALPKLSHATKDPKFTKNMVFRRLKNPNSRHLGKTIEKSYFEPRLGFIIHNLKITTNHKKLIILKFCLVKNLFFKALYTCAYEMVRKVKNSQHDRRTVCFWFGDV